jgi:hypothetical protein
MDEKTNRNSTFVMLAFFFRSDWTLAARGAARWEVLVAGDSDYA